MPTTRRRLAAAFVVLLLALAARGAAAYPGLEVWAVGDAEKRFQDAGYEASNFFWDGGSRTVRLHAGANEVIGFQIALRSTQAFAGVDLVPAGNFTGPGGSIPAANLDFYLEYYADIEIAGNDYPGDHGFDLIWPDALIPFADPYESNEGDIAAPFAMEAGITELVWVDLFVPAGTQAGQYTATLEVRVGAALAETLTLALKVWDFELPTQNHLWHYGLLTARWGDGEGVALRNLPASWPILKNYLIDGRKHRLCWDDTYWPCPSFDAEGHLTAMDWTEFDLYEGQRLSASLFTEGPMAGAPYELARLTFPVGGAYPPGCPNIFYPPDPDPVGNPVYANTIREYVEEYVRHFAAKGWDMPLALYGYDEVGSAEYHQWWSGLVEQANQNLIDEGVIAAPRVLYMYVRAANPVGHDRLCGPVGGARERLQRGVRPGAAGRGRQDDVLPLVRAAGGPPHDQHLRLFHAHEAADRLEVSRGRHLRRVVRHHLAVPERALQRPGQRLLRQPLGQRRALLPRPPALAGGLRRGHQRACAVLPAQGPAAGHAGLRVRLAAR